MYEFPYYCDHYQTHKAIDDQTYRLELVLCHELPHAVMYGGHFLVYSK